MIVSVIFTLRRRMVMEYISDALTFVKLLNGDQKKKKKKQWN